MKKAIILLFFLFIASFAKAQSADTEYHLISLSGDNADAVPMRFYVAGIYDGRQFTDNIGTVQKGLANRKVLARLEKPFTEEISEYLMRAFPKKDSLYPVWVRIDDLYVSEHTDSKTETGYASVVMEVIEKKSDNYYITGAFGANMEGEGLDVTGKHAERIKRALNKCLAKYEVQPEEDKLNTLFTNTTEKREIPVKPVEGAYVSYLDMLKNTPLQNSNYYITNKKEKYYLINKTNSLLANDFYAYSDGETVYLNVSKFADGTYYAKTERIADKYFIRNISYSATNAQDLLLQYGLIGALADVIINQDKHIPLLIDCYSGQPFFLSNGNIKSMLKSNPELLEEYKKGKKSNDEIKEVTRKYYELQASKN